MSPYFTSLFQLSIPAAHFSQTELLQRPLVASLRVSTEGPQLCHFLPFDVTSFKTES